MVGTLRTRTGAPTWRGAGRWRKTATTLAACAVAVAVGSACSGLTDGTAEDEQGISDPAEAVAAIETRTEDVVVPPGGEDVVDSSGDAGNDEADQHEIDLLAIRGEIINEYNLLEGECFNRVDGLQSGRRVVITARVGCTEPHRAEVFHTFELDVAHPGIYPGDNAIRGFALRKCYDRFEPFVGMSYELSDYEIDVLTPNRTNFEDEVARYRGVHCWLYHIDGEPLSGSAKGTRQ